MPIALAHRPVTLPLRQPFRISRGAVDEYHVVEVALTHDGVTGYGEATPDPHFGETVATVAAFCDSVVGLLGDDPFALEAIERRVNAELPGDRAAAAAVDAALHDLIGKLLGVPVWKLLGTAPGGPPTVWTIVLGEPDAMGRGAAEADAAGRLRALKLKLGGRDGLDVDRVRAVRAASALPLMVDVNEYWSLEEAVENIAELASLGVAFVEQPLPAGDPGGVELRRRSALPVYVDEDCHTLADVASCAERAHGINIKLAKSGGIREAIRMVHAARALGLGVMLGCMGESSLGIAAGCPIAPLCDHVDLDGNLPLSEDPWQGVELIDGVQVASGAPGLGVTRR